MTEPEFIDRVKSVLIEEFELDGAALHPDANLYENLGLDSLDSVDLVVALEKEFGFKVVRTVDEERIRAIRTIQDIVDFVVEKTETGAA